MLGNVHYYYHAVVPSWILAGGAVAFLVILAVTAICIVGRRRG